jgi:hypothetical protein
VEQDIQVDVLLHVPGGGNGAGSGCREPDAQADQQRARPGRESAPGPRCRGCPRSVGDARTPSYWGRQPHRSAATRGNTRSATGHRQWLPRGAQMSPSRSGRSARNPLSIAALPLDGCARSGPALQPAGSLADRS